MAGALNLPAAKVSGHATARLHDSTARCSGQHASHVSSLARTRCLLSSSAQLMTRPTARGSHGLGFSWSTAIAGERPLLYAGPHCRRIVPKRGGALVTKAAVFDQLSSRLESAWTLVSREGKLTRENMKEPMREVRRALLEADVSLPVVRRFCSSVVDKAVGTTVMKGIRSDQKLVKVVADELKELMGGSVSELVFAKEPPSVILLAGLQGVGKTTAAGKLALYLKKKGKKVMMVATDVYRPAAIDQLVTIGRQVEVPVFQLGTSLKPVDIAKKGIIEACRSKVDVVIVDTAGRLQIDAGMMKELKDVKAAVKPAETLLVVDAMTGQEAAGLVASFNTEVGITGAILTKVDGDSRGGAALSVKEVSGKPIKFVGEGEGMAALEPFYPERMASRILGMGDVVSFVEKAEEAISSAEAQKMSRRLLDGKFNFNDMLTQMRATTKMGGLASMMQLMPGANKFTPKEIRESEKRLKVMESMVNSMSPYERRHPEVLAKEPLRRRRIAKGSGRSELQVSELVSQLFVMRAQLQKISQMTLGNTSLPGLAQMQKEVMQGKLKAAPGTAKRRKNRSMPFLNGTGSKVEAPKGFGRRPVGAK